MDTDHTARAIKVYDEICRAYERIDDFRAKLLGVLPVASGVGLFILLGKEGVGAAHSSDWRFLAFSGSFGAIATIGLLLYEQRGIQYCIRLTTVAQALESSLRIAGRFTNWPHSVRRFTNEPAASGLVYSATIAAWVFVAISRVAPVAAVASVISGIFCFLGTRAFYWWVTWSEEMARGGRPTRNIWWDCFSRYVNRFIIKQWPTQPGEEEANWLNEQLGRRELASPTLCILADRLSEEAIDMALRITGPPDKRGSMTRWNLAEICRLQVLMHKRRLSYSRSS